jgi:NAD(P)-dependent dehydrogenase (short-subunit alcohol dehydrogenase family)
VTGARVVLVTGASSGIGAATATALAAHGFTVFGTSRRPDRAGGARVTMLSLDVRSDDSVAAVVREVLARAGRIDVLVNNAGYVQAGALEENSLAAAQAQLETNLLGVMRMIRAVLPGMRGQGGGRIVNVSSVAGRFAPAYVGLYAASKFALEGLTEALRYEVRQFGIHVSLIEPGFVRTAIASRAPENPMAEYAGGRQAALAHTREGVARGSAPAAVARVILTVATTPRPRLRYPVGGGARLLIALDRFLPEAIAERMLRRNLAGARSG